MKNLNLKNCLPAVCQAVAGKKGIKIVWQGPPRTDGRTIYSHPLPVEADEDAVKVILGDLDHECGHILYSDFDLLRQEKPDPLRKAVWNALEDIMEERLLGLRYLGCRETLADSARIAVQRGMCRTGKAGPSDALITFLDAWGRVHVTGHEVQVILESSEMELEKAIGRGGVEKLVMLLAAELPGLESTQDTLALTDKVLELVQSIRDGTQDQDAGGSDQSQDQDTGDGDQGQGEDAGDDDQGQDEDAGDGDQGQNEGTGDGDQGQDEDTGDGDQGQDEDTGDGDQGQDEDTEDGDQGQNEDTGDGNQGQDEDAGDGDQGQDEDTRDCDQSLDKEAGDGDQEQDRYASGARAILEDPDVESEPVVDRSRMQDEVRDAVGWGVYTPPASNEVSTPNWSDNRERYQRLRDGIRGELTLLQRRLANEFQTVTRARTLADEQGRVDAKRLHLALTGNRRIFKRKVKTLVPRPAVSLVIDCSGSMMGNPIEYAIQAVIAMAEVCERLAVPTEIVTFVQTGMVGPVKTFDQPLRWGIGRIGGIQADGCDTPADDAMWIAGNRLATRKEQRKLMLFVTDGQPNRLETARQVVTLVERAGIELYGIGIQMDGIRGFITNSEVIEAPSDIAKVILTVLAQRICKAA